MTIIDNKHNISIQNTLKPFEEEEENEE